jgi:hypothetical protein
MKHLRTLQNDKYIKRFNELFDTDTLKSTHEIDYLTGELEDNILKGKYGNALDKSKDGGYEKLRSLLERLLHRGCHQLLVFFENHDVGVKAGMWIKKESEFGRSKYSENEFYLLGLENSKYFLAFGIHFLENDKFDLLFSDTEDAELKRDQSFEDIYIFVKYKWTKLLAKFENEKLMNIGKSSFITNNN